MDKHLRIKKETHDKFQRAKGMLASQGKFVSLQTLADNLITEFIEKMEKQDGSK